MCECDGSEMLMAYHLLKAALRETEAERQRKEKANRVDPESVWVNLFLRTAFCGVLLLHNVQ